MYLITIELYPTNLRTQVKSYHEYNLTGGSYVVVHISLVEILVGFIACTVHQSYRSSMTLFRNRSSDRQPKQNVIQSQYHHQALGVCSTVSRVIGLGCPFVANLAVYWKPLPMVLLGTPTLLVAGIMIWYVQYTG